MGVLRDDILSVKDEKVVEAIHRNIGYGNYVTVQHGDNEFSRYAHFSSIQLYFFDYYKNYIIDFNLLMSELKPSVDTYLNSKKRTNPRFVIDALIELSPIKLDINKI